jgi:hypothetical protein
MAGDDEEILALFHELPRLLDMHGGQVRIAPRYSEGLLRRSLEMREFRIPANRLSRRQQPRPRRVSVEARVVLEQIADRLHATGGDIEIVAEYNNRRLRWIDLVTQLELELRTDTTA